MLGARILLSVWVGADIEGETGAVCVCVCVCVCERIGC